jgi:hypothetical protein
LGFQLPLVLVVMAVQTEKLPVAAVRRIVVVIVIAMVNRQLSNIRTRKYSGTAATDPRIDLQRSLTIALGALVSSAPCFGHNPIEPARIGWIHAATLGSRTRPILAAFWRFRQVHTRVG